MTGELELQLARARRAYEDAKRAGFKADGSPGSALNAFKPESYEAEIRECEKLLAEARRRPGDSDPEHLNDYDDEPEEYGPCKECGYPRTRSGLCPKCD